MNSIPFVNWNNIIDREAMTATLRALQPDELNALAYQLKEYTDLVHVLTTKTVDPSLDGLIYDLRLQVAAGSIRETEAVRLLRTKTGLGLREAFNALRPSR